MTPNHGRQAFLGRYNILRKVCGVYRQLTDKERQQLQQVHDEYESVLSPYASKNIDALREHESKKYDGYVLRTQYALDIDRIIHGQLYNRGNDKTQVFSFYRNDDITRRFSHMQLVSRIGRTIGKVLKLNVDLIEAIAIGHDVGHTPFGHKGEEFLNELYRSQTGRYFNHNVHSVRILQKITGCNLTLQTLDGILCHCGEKAFAKYEPASVSSFSDFNDIVEGCYTEQDAVKALRPSTLEGCVVRISDMVAYLKKDRQDAKKAKFISVFPESELGPDSEILDVIMTDIVQNSLDKPYLSISDDVFGAIKQMLDENNDLIYQREEVTEPYFKVIKPMMEILYNKFLKDLEGRKYGSPIYQHYINTKIVEKFYWTRTKSQG